MEPDGDTRRSKATRYVFDGWYETEYELRAAAHDDIQALEKEIGRLQSMGAEDPIVAIASWRNEQGRAVIATPGGGSSLYHFLLDINRFFAVLARSWNKHGPKSVQDFRIRATVLEFLEEELLEERKFRKLGEFDEIDQPFWDDDYIPPPPDPMEVPF